MAKAQKNETTADSPPSSGSDNLAEDWVVRAFSALAQETRLAILRLLLRHAPGELSAGDVAQAVQIPPSTLSFHLSRLERAELVQSCRRHRNIYYQVNLIATRDLAGFLLEECCRETKSKAQLAAFLSGVDQEQVWKKCASTNTDLN